jgi:PAS domain S-box-containing protein
VPQAVVVMNQLGRVVLVNVQVERPFGYSQDELPGRAIESLVPESYRGTHVGQRIGYFADPLVGAS